MSESRDLRVIVDKRGRTFELGAAVIGRPGVVVAGIRKLGNFATVRFELAQTAPVVPPPIVIHVDDVMAWK